MTEEEIIAWLSQAHAYGLIRSFFGSLRRVPRAGSLPAWRPATGARVIAQAESDLSDVCDGEDRVGDCARIEAVSRLAA